MTTKSRILTFVYMCMDRNNKSTVVVGMNDNDVHIVNHEWAELLKRTGTRFEFTIPVTLETLGTLESRLAEKQIELVWTENQGLQWKKLASLKRAGKLLD